MVRSATRGLRDTRCSPSTRPNRAPLSRRPAAQITEQAIWIDLLNPTQEEEAKIERALKIDVPTREEQAGDRGLEPPLSGERRALHDRDGALPGRDGRAATTPVTFILAGQRLITVRYAEPRAFSHLSSRAATVTKPNLTNGTAVLIGLIETIVDRLADFIERIQAEVEALSHSIFEMKGGAASRQRRFDVLLNDRARRRDTPRASRESAHSLGRLLTFLAHAANERKEDKLLQARIRTAARDVHSADRPCQLSCPARSCSCSMPRSA